MWSAEKSSKNEIIYQKFKKVEKREKGNSSMKEDERKRRYIKRVKTGSKGNPG